MPEEIRVPGLARFRHVYIPGKTQHGKSTLMANQIYDDIKIGRGVCVMDAKGDLIRQVMDAIPYNRKDDVIYFDKTHPLPIDLLRSRDHFECNAILHELTQALLRKVNEADAPEMGNNIRNILRTIFDYNDHQKDPRQRATLLDIFYFMDDVERREHILKGVVNPKIKRRWNNPKSIPSGQAYARITLRTDDYYFSDFLGALFDVPNPPVNMEWVINNRKILLINLAPMSDQMLLYATMILSQIRQVVDRRGDIPPSKHIPFFLYCDEFHEYQTTDFPKFMARAGGLGLCLTLANQWVTQLTKEVADAVVGSASTFFLFRMGKQNGSYFKEYFPDPRPSDKPHARERERLQKEIRKINDDIRFFDEQYKKGGNDLLNQCTDPIKVDRLIYERTLCRKRLAALPDDLPDPVDYLAKLPHLSVGVAVYIPADGEVCGIDTPKPLGKLTNYAEEIRKRTLELYSCETVDRSYHESKPSIATLSDDIPPQTKTDVPPNPHKKTGARTSR